MEKRLLLGNPSVGHIFYLTSIYVKNSFQFSFDIFIFSKNWHISEGDVIYHQNICIFFSGYSNQLWRVWSRNRVWFSHNWRWRRSRWFKNDNTSVSRTIKHSFDQQICYNRKWHLLLLYMQYTWRHHLGRGFHLLWINDKSVWDSFLKGNFPWPIGNAPDETADGCQDLLMWWKTSVCSWTHTLWPHEARNCLHQESRGHSIHHIWQRVWGCHPGTPGWHMEKIYFFQRRLTNMIEIQILLNLNRNIKDLYFSSTNERENICHFLPFSVFRIDIFDSIYYVIRIIQDDTWPWKENCLEIWRCALLCIICRLTGSFVPDLIVSMSHQMWLHLQSDESVGSIGFKINYKGTQTDRIFCCLHWCLHFTVCFFYLSVLSCSRPWNSSETRLFYSSPAPL